MIPFLGCERARDLLDGYVDGELPVSDQVAIEAHLRVCATCAARVEDLQLIASSIRFGSLGRQTPEDDRALAGLQASTLIRVRTERDEAVTARLREAFADMRLLWPALGAVAAVAMGLTIAFSMLSRAGSERPESLAAMIHAVAQRGVVHAAEAHGSLPGSEGNPLRLDATMFGPQVIDVDAVSFDTILDDEAVFAVSALVSSSGRIADYELLGVDGGTPGRRAERRASDVEAVHDAVTRMRFAPALAADGRGVAVEMVLFMAKTTATLPRPLGVVAPVPAAPAVAPALLPDERHDEDALDADDEPVLRDYDSGTSRTPWLPWT